MVVRIEFNLFPQISANLEGRASEVVRKTAFDIESNWVANIGAAGLVDTGAYLLSVFAEEASGPTHWEVGTNLTDPPYPWFLEYGTARGIPAHGVMTKAVEVVRPAFHEAMRQLIEMSV